MYKKQFISLSIEQSIVQSIEKLLLTHSKEEVKEMILKFISVDNNLDDVKIDKIDQYAKTK